MRIGTERMHKIFPLWLWNEHIVRYLFAANFVSEKIVIDCACGSGVGSKVFLEKGAASLIGFDASEGAIKLAKSNNANSIRGKFIIANAHKLPLENNYADVFISLETVEHVQDDRLFLQEAFRVLRPGGYFICSTPNRIVTNPGKKINDKPWNKFHVREYSKREFEDLIKKEFSSVVMYGLNRLTLARMNFENKIRKTFFINGYVWTNLKKFPRIFSDDLSNYSIELVDERYEYEYFIAVCTKE